ncbi:hypothetical protein QQ045_027170 [Rhodiola kirilowii]
MRIMTMNVDPMCVFCKAEEETRDHLFFHCCTSREVVGMVLNVLQVSNMPVQWHLLIPWFNSLNQKHIRTRLIAAAISGAMYEIWCARNNVIFRGHNSDPVTIDRNIIWGLKIKIGGLYKNLSKLELHDSPSDRPKEELRLEMARDCLVRVTSGVAIGGALGGAVGAVYGTYEAIRYKVPGLMKIRYIGQTTLGSAAVFGLFLGAGSLLHCGKSY